MSLSTTTNRVSYSGNGSTTVFSFPYYFLADGDLVVLLVTDSTGASVTQVITTDYTVSGAGAAAGGSVTMLTAPASGETLVIYRDPALTQGLDLRENDAAPAEEMEEAHDRAMMIMQRHDELIGRSARFADSYTGGASIEVPNPEANTILGWNDAGDALENKTNESAITTPGTSTDNAVVRFNGTTGTNIQDSGVLVDDSNNVTIPGTLSVTGGQDMVDNVTAIVDNGDNTKKLKFDAAGITTATTRTVTVPDADTTMVGTDVAQTLSGKTFSDAITGAQITTPSNPASGYNKIYFKSDDKPYVLDSAGNETDIISGDSTLNIASKSANYTVTTNDDLLLADSSGGAFTFTMPTEADSSGLVFTFKKTSSDFNAVTIDNDAAGEITTINTEGETVKITSDGTSWYVIDRYIPNVATSYSLTITGTTSNPSKASSPDLDQAYWSRVGDKILITYNYVHTSNSGAAAGSGVYIFGLPSGLTVDTSKLAIYSSGYTALDGAVANNGANDYWGVSMVYDSSENGGISMKLGNSGNALQNVGSTYNAINGATVRYSFKALVPVTGWKG